MARHYAIAQNLQATTEKELKAVLRSSVNEFYASGKEQPGNSHQFIASRLKLRCITIDDNPTPIITNEQPQPQRQLQLQRSQQQRKRLKPLRQLQVLRIPI
ncbi:hypothetical protein L596_010403 [Steinernema carpocapsae]|uniref:Uncharacterized protein n=1 Tax=Steinernema carpocapsae TaxID=34508 RepID=A0A4U5PI79_STECR|nr:hypothetical protein L596_010403 [Steinernema carpocapsae]